MRVGRTGMGGSKRKKGIAGKGKGYDEGQLKLMAILGVRWKPNTAEAS